MDCTWIKVSSSLQKGITIMNHLENSKFEQFLRRIIAKMRALDLEIFNNEEKQKLCKIFSINKDELMLAIKTIIYLFKRLLKFIFMPANLKSDLNKIGLINEKADFIVKVWSAETRTMLDSLGSEATDKNGDNLNFSWKMNAEVSSEYQKKCKVPKTYLCFNEKQIDSEIELTHPELYSIFLQFESIQNELDNVL